MKFTCLSTILKQEIEYANIFSGQKNSLSIMSNVFLEASNDTLNVRTTDQKMGFSSSIGVNVILPGSTTVFCEKLLAVLKNPPETEIEISDDNGNLTIKPVDKNSFTINIKTIGAEKFPPLLSAEDSLYFSIPQRDFLDMIDKTSFAVSDDETRFFLCGVYLEKHDSNLVMVATDGKKLAKVDRLFEQTIPDFHGAIMPVKFLAALKSVSTGEGLFSLAIEEGTIFARIGERTIYSSLITGKDYPNYDRVIPKKEKLEYRCTMKTKDLDNALLLTSTLVESKSRKILVNVSPTGVTISGESADGDSNRTIDCSYDGPENTMKFNCSVIQIPVKKVTSEFLSILYTSPQSAMILTPEPESDYFFVIMPMQS